MIRWLEENPIGQGLAAACLALCVFSVLLAVIWMLPPSADSMGDENEEKLASQELPELKAVRSIKEFSEITGRPVFNQSRQPVIEVEELETEEELPPEEVDTPDLVLAGVVITPSLRMATLRQQGQEFSLVAFEGAPLEGDYGTWQVSRIEPRQVTLAASDGKELQLQLEIHDATIEAPARPEPELEAKEAPEDTPLAARTEGQPLSRAEEIRQRIAERREELRQAAEAEAEAGADEKKPEMTYQQAIQSMMGKKSQDKPENDENE